MGFDEFLSRRLTELLRFAIVLCRSAEDAERLVVEVLVQAFSHWGAVVAAGREFVLLRTAVARHYLATAEDPADRTGNGTGASPTSKPAPPGGTAGLIAALSGVPALGVAALTLWAYSSQTAPEIAGALRCSEQEAATALEHARSALRELADVADSRRSADVIEQFAQSFPVDHDAVASAVLDRLESEPAREADPAVFEAMFVLAAAQPIELPPPPRGKGLSAPERPGEVAGAHPVTGSTSGSGPRAGAAVPGAASRRTEPGRHGVRAGRAGAALMLIAAAAVVSGLSSNRSEAGDQPRGPRAPSQTAQPSGTGPTGGGATAALPAPGGQPLPGTTVLGQYAGIGSQTVPGVRHRVAAGRALAVDVVCSGPGGASVGPVVIEHCAGASVGQNVTAEQLTSLAVRADPSTTWRFVVIDEPARRTNGRTRYPVDPALTSGSPISRVAQAEGTGSGTVPLVAASTTSRVENLRVILACTGDGVTLSSADHRFDGLYARSCVAGYSYEFDVASAVVPDTVSVSASKATAWRLAVIRS